MELMLSRGGTLARGRVTEPKRDHKGNVIGRYNANPILDTQEYEVKFEDGDVTELTANAMLNRCTPCEMKTVTISY